MRNTDWEVVGLVRLGRIGSLRRINEVLDGHPDWAARIRLVWHDLRSPVNEYTAEEIGPVDYIVHAAASTHVDESIKRPVDFVMDNVLATCNLLQYARGLPGLLRLQYFSTDEVTGPAPDGVRFTETAAINPTNPYSATKMGAEALVNAFGNTYRLPVFTTRTMNLIGERASTEKFLPLLIRKLLLGEKVTIHADPTRTRAGQRHYLHCRNAAAATLFLLERADQRGLYNVVGDAEVDNLTLAQMVAEMVGKPLEYEMVDWHSSRPGHDIRYALSGEKLLEMGFVYPVSFEESLRRTVEWTLNHRYWIGL